MGDNERKGLRFEVFPDRFNGWGKALSWKWSYIGAEGVICESYDRFESEKAARSHIHANRGRLGNAKRAKVVTVND